MTDDDHRDWLTHLVHGVGHLINSSLKNNGEKGIEESSWYREKSPDKAKNGPWPASVDDERAGYHLQKFSEQMEKIMLSGPPN
jgi:hypothetical protein